MRIESSQVSYATEHSSVSATAVIDKSTARSRASVVRPVAASPVQAQAQASDSVQISGLLGTSGEDGLQDLQGLTPKQRLAALAIQLLVGHKIKWLHLPSSAGNNTAAASTPANNGTAEVHRRTELHSEMEQTRFQAQGVVETADGRSIQFSVRLDMRREFQSSTTATLSSETADPLVVNFGGMPARLTGAKIAFDLNSDGQPETISFVAGGSGFLALDNNGDGKVNDGSELFGPQTGNGYSELASYDADRNGWIDENDLVFAKLRIWSQDGLSTLSEKGIGAISTSSAETPFALKDSSNVLQANILSTGIYLSENGVAGTVQQVDLAVG